MPDICQALVIAPPEVTCGRIAYALDEYVRTGSSTPPFSVDEEMAVG